MRDWHFARRLVPQGDGVSLSGSQSETLWFPTTDPSTLVKPIHDKAMPVALPSHDETEAWTCAPWDEAEYLARPPPVDDLVISSREPYGSTIVSKTGEPVEQRGRSQLSQSASIIACR